MSDSYAEKYALPIERKSANGKTYTVKPLVQRDLRQWVGELKAEKIKALKADLPAMMKPVERAERLEAINSTEYTPGNLRYLVSNTVDGAIRVLEIAGAKLGLQGQDLIDFVDGTSGIQNEKDAFKISGLFLPDDYIQKFRDEFPSFARQLFDAAYSGNEAKLIQIAKDAAAEAKENERLEKEAKAKKDAAETTDPNGQSQS